MRPSIPGYTYGQKSLATAPYSLQDLESLKKSMLFTDDDVHWLRTSKPILADQTEAILDVWYGFVASTPELTDQADSVPSVNFRYLSALTIPVTTTLKPFLAAKGASAADVDKMHAAWVKSVLLQTILWSHPYVRDGLF